MPDDDKPRGFGDYSHEPSPHGGIPPDDDRPSIAPKIAWRTAAGFVGCVLLLLAGVPFWPVLCVFVAATAIMLLTM